MELVTVQGSMQLEAKAAAAWLALVAAARREAGVTPILSSPAGAYRSEELVVDMWRNPSKYGASQGVAKPISLGGGGSVHQNGRCVDVNNWASFGDLVVSRGFRRSRRLDTLAAAHGFYPDSRYPNEPWHYQHNGATPAGGGVEIIMDWGDSIPTRDPDKGFGATGIRVPVSEVLAYTEAYGKGLYRIKHRKPENPQQTDGQTNDIGTLVAFAEANTSYARGQLTAIAKTADEVKAIVEKLGAPTSIQVTVPPESIKAALLDPEVVAALRGPTLEQIVAAVDAADDDEHAAILAAITQLPAATLATLGLQRIGG